MNYKLYLESVEKDIRSRGVLASLDPSILSQKTRAFFVFLVIIGSSEAHRKAIVFYCSITAHYGYGARRNGSRRSTTKKKRLRNYEMPELRHAKGRERASKRAERGRRRGTTSARPAKREALSRRYKPQKETNAFAAEGTRPDGRASRGSGRNGAKREAAVSLKTDRSGDTCRATRRLLPWD